MWSYVQYRRLGKEVERDVEKRKNATQYHKTSHCRRPRKTNENVENKGSESPSRPTQDRDEERKLTSHPNRQNGNNGPNEERNSTKDHILVECDGDDDPLDPRNWPLLSRAKNITILSLLTFVQAWAGASNSQVNSRASQHYHVIPVAENLATALYLFGIGSGCLFVGPLSETVGRNPTYLVSTFCYLWLVLGSALSKNFGSQIVCRFFIGLCCSATLGINGASVRDMFRPVKRAMVFPVIAWANVVRRYYLSVNVLIG